MHYTPGCKLSSSSNIRLSDRVKAPGIFTPNGEWVGYPWISHSPDGAELKKWIDWDAKILDYVVPSFLPLILMFMMKV